MPGFEWYFKSDTRFFSITQGCSEVFCNVGYYRECRRHEPFRGVWGYPPPENFQVRRLQNAICSTCHEICLRKIDLEDENGKQLQITVIKITESKENKSIHRLDLSGSTSPGGQLPNGSVTTLNWLGWSSFDIHIGWKLLIEGVVVSIILQRFLQQSFAFQTPRLLAADLYGQVQFIFKFITLVISSIALL